MVPAWGGGCLSQVSKDKREFSCKEERKKEGREEALSAKERELAKERKSRRSATFRPRNHFVHQEHIPGRGNLGGGQG